ncbi:MAG TPA: alpha/beta fold hydrolase [Candidatus Polarisedimenticolia bacterium]|nr:alpha/beta fold hydrolase [Candidatus Polarisedimenticolia bacterium]
MSRVSGRIGAVAAACMLAAGVIAPRPACAGGVKSGSAPVNGARLFYEVAGEGEPVVLLEGGQLDRRMWDEQFAAFSRKYRVIRFDVRGFGASAPRNGPYQSHEDLFAMLEYLHVPSAHLVGLSLGGRIAIDLALTHPEKVRTLILAGPGLSGFPWSDTRTQWGDRLRRAAAAGDGKASALAWLESDYMMPAASNAKTRRRVRELALANARTWTQPDEEEELKPSAYSRLSQIHLPTLVLVGSLDIPDIHRIADKLVADIPGARKIVLEGAGHMVNMEAPARFNETVLDFLDATSRASQAASPEPSPGEARDDEVKAAVQALRDAGIRRDVEALERLYAPDYFHTNPDGSTMGRQQVLASYRSKPAMIFSSVEADEWTSILRGTFAVASERTALHGKTADGHPFISRYRVTYLLERRNGSWRFVCSHASLLGIDRSPATGPSDPGR